MEATADGDLTSVHLIVSSHRFLSRGSHAKFLRRDNNLKMTRLAVERFNTAVGSKGSSTRWGSSQGYELVDNHFFRIQTHVLGIVLSLFNHFQSIFNRVRRPPSFRLTVPE